MVSQLCEKLNRWFAVKIQSFDGIFVSQMLVERISQEIYQYTEKHFLIEELIIEVPHQKCLAGKPISKSTQNHPEVRVGNFAHLSSLQYGPCATPGKGVLFPSTQLVIMHFYFLHPPASLWCERSEQLFVRINFIMSQGTKYCLVKRYNISF